MSRILALVRPGVSVRKYFTIKFASSEPELRPGGQGASVRILGMIDRLKPNVTTHCKLWFDNNGPPVFSNVTGRKRKGQMFRFPIISYHM